MVECKDALEDVLLLPWGDMCVQIYSINSISCECSIHYIFRKDQFLKLIERVDKLAHSHHDLLKENDFDSTKNSMI